MLTRNPDARVPTTPDWPRLTPDEGALANRLAVPREPLALTLGTRTARVEIEATGPSFDGLDIPFVLGTEHGYLRLPHAVLQQLARDAGLAAVPVREAPAARALLLEWMLLDLVAHLEAAGAGALHILTGDLGGPDRDAARGTRLVFGTLTLGGHERHPFRLDLPQALASRLAEAREILAPARPAEFDALPIPLGIQIGRQQLTLRDLGDLRPGDVVMLADEAPTLRAGPHHAAPLERTAHGYRMTAALGRPQARTQDDSSMSDASTDGDGLETVPIGLVFEVGRLEMPLGELRQLGPGSVLPLDRPDDQLVDILANGRRIGRGTLVRIGEGLGLRVVQLSHG